MKKDTHLTIRISSEELQEIKEFAASKQKGFTEFVLQAIREKMGREETIELRVEALEKYVYGANVA